MSPRFAMAALLVVLTNVAVGCTANTDAAEEGEASTFAVSTDPVAQAGADFDALLDEIEALIAAEESGVCLTNAPPATLPELGTENGPASGSAQSGPATPVARVKMQAGQGAIVEWLAQRLARLEALGGRIERATKICAACAGSAEKLAAILERAALKLAECEKLLKGITKAAIESNLWRNLTPSERFDLQRYIRFGEWFNSKTGKYERGVPQAGYWPSFYKPYQDAFAAQRKAVEDMIRLEALIEDYRTLNFIAKYHLDKCAVTGVTK